MVNYKAGDYLIRIKNAAMAGRKVTECENTKLINAISQVLVEKKILDEASVDKKTNMIKSVLKFHKKQPLILNVKLISKPGLRIYINRDELTKRKAASFLIISTPNGVMSSDKALKKGVGGEVIAEIW